MRVIVPFFYVLCALSEKQILRKNFFVTLTYQDVPLGQKFRLLNMYFSEKDMTGYRSGVVAKIEEVAHTEMLFTHCIIH